MPDLWSWLPWRSHTHVHVLARIGEGQDDAMFDAVAAAAHRPGRHVTVSGSAQRHFVHADGSSIGGCEVWACCLSRRAAEELRDRARDALAILDPSPSETHVMLRHRCRCRD
jgi:hypothetical protein